MLRKSMVLLLLVPAVAGCAPRAGREYAPAGGAATDSGYGAVGGELPIIPPPPLSSSVPLDVPSSDTFGSGSESVSVAPLSPPSSSSSLLPASQPMQVASAPVDDRMNRRESSLITVAPGDTVYSLARRYYTSPQTLIRLNNLTPPYAVGVGQRLRVPAADGSTNDAAAEPEPFIAPADADTGSIAAITDRLNLPSPLEGASNADATDVADAPDAAPARTARLLVPVEGAGIKADYGQTYRGKPVNGIVYAAYEDAPVRAAAAGRVVYVGEAAGYGQVVLVRHDDGLLTNYGLLKRVLTAQGKRVRAGEVIARAGKSAGSNQAAVVFEVRKGTQPQNPNTFLGQDG